MAVNLAENLESKKERKKDMKMVHLRAILRVAAMVQTKAD